VRAVVVRVCVVCVCCVCCVCVRVRVCVCVCAFQRGMCLLAAALAQRFARPSLVLVPATRWVLLLLYTATAPLGGPCALA
jgi:hypothetical protein